MVAGGGGAMRGGIGGTGQLYQHWQWVEVGCKFTPWYFCHMPSYLLTIWHWLL
jgi:hypothetical protein